MNSIDFSCSFIWFTTTRVNHTPRLQVDAACRIVTADGARDFYLSAPCAGETMYADAGLIQQPGYEFIVIYAPPDQFLFAKTYADATRNVVELHRVGEMMGTHDGRGAPMVDMGVHLAPAPAPVEIESYPEIRAAILGNLPLNGRTECQASDGTLQAILDYPIKICNVSHATERWQVDTGPVLLPDPDAVTAADQFAGLRPGFLVYNALTWAESSRRRLAAGDPVVTGSFFSAPRRLNTRNRIFVLR